MISFSSLNDQETAMLVMRSILCQTKHYLDVIYLIIAIIKAVDMILQELLIGNQLGTAINGLGLQQAIGTIEID